MSERTVADFKYKSVREYDKKELSNLMFACYYDWKKTDDFPTDDNNIAQIDKYREQLFEYVRKNNLTQEMADVEDLSPVDLNNLCQAVINARRWCQSNIPKMTNENQIKDYIEDVLVNSVRYKKNWNIQSNHSVSVF